MCLLANKIREQVHKKKKDFEFKIDVQIFRKQLILAVKSNSNGLKNLNSSILQQKKQFLSHTKQNMPYVYKKNGKLHKTKKLQKVLRENGVKAVKSIICSNNY